MVDWLRINEIEKNRRKSFLVGQGRATTSEIWRIEQLFQEIRETATGLKTSWKHLKACRFKGLAQYEMKEESMRLLMAYESLEQMVSDRQDIEDQFSFEIAATRRTVWDVLVGVDSQSSQGRLTYKKKELYQRRRRPFVRSNSQSIDS